ncbi:hypothetical protein FHX74_001279 [Friedmanniella endophytica]|uniref:TrbL/VirB6 plasmid conjugal transfer protein n=1 Tax=Microlunatus kandeliicorticis TaxID=1759536 RepID=A0A7W3IR30_9ACTN|nr:hypothetical protein [Microlunatus kandeliicorticis]MBA8793674.1 hypothetical protein [Microlunatus kandeliicorticis]
MTRSRQRSSGKRGTATQRLVVRLLLAGVIAAAALLVSARPAAADICSDAPAPIAPKSGLPGMLTSKPADVPDSAPDPFKNPSVPIGDVYGYNWQWANYDLGCGSDFLSDPVAVTNTQSANVVMSLTGATLAQLDTLEHLAKGFSIDWLTNVVTAIAGKLQGPLLGLWLPVAVLGVGLIIGFRAKRSSYADTMRSMLVIVGSVALAAFALLFPTTLSSSVDRGVVELSNVAGQQFSASGSDAVTRESAYRTWLTGNFGDPDSPTAVALGPRLMSATHYTWSDMKRMQADPEAKQSIDRDKAREFKAVADELKTKDPAAYETFTGRGERTGPALFGVVVVLAMSLFIGLAMLMVMIARVMMQGLVLAAPLAVILGVLPTHTTVLRRLWDLFTAAAVAVVKFVIAGGVMALVLGAIQSADSLSGGAKLFWVVVATVVGIVLTRPLRSFKTIVPGLDPNRSYVRAAASGVASYFGAKFGSEQGVERGVVAAAAANGSDAQSPSTEALESLGSLPSPAWQTAVAAPALSSSTSGVPGGSSLQLGAATPVTAVALPVGSAAQARQAWPGIVGRRTAVAALPAGPNRIDAAEAADPEISEPDAQAGPDLGSRLRPFPPITTTSADAAEPGGERPGDVVRPRPGVPARGGVEVVYPTGVIVADEDGPLYSRSTASDAPAEVYVPAAELELDEDGHEQPLVMYRSNRAESVHAPA